MLLAGIPAVLIAAILVTNMRIDIVKWLVVVVVTYTAINLLPRRAPRSADRRRSHDRGDPARRRLTANSEQSPSESWGFLLVAFVSCL